MTVYNIFGKRSLRATTENLHGEQGASSTLTVRRYCWREKKVKVTSWYHAVSSASYEKIYLINA